ncbi:MAG: hypothetical protein UX91_C0005G0003 [Candidatus Amesbacteria bacterium GW2011_GWB1_47_19]|nr:MAG: hypothetical protein UW51_C0007G0003 [Candidatus Amesbacteria bacterium GW2011_GWA1_44_24]KKU31085.1 MAG: hypothetical protein UX46_C0007G0003 [Candidatus Amesbacteria bacterium GW2011_GWC1_46_24]KKU67206.1 MAG: hypothetical protein UX91_C0005G0003 [Candidatus Amesbacteria bacterium GW2011_GWB1_47_19]OGD05767.1 MAG: hypothetical protein A2379_01415 [Candidatus Amesbacteria bacterium RIFOXYB1_FULL_47_13]HBC72622.1 hypothetical protein [Candidatus Amesbacteria bacterium]
MSKTKPAFSLIELLIAIVLLGLMAALVLSRIGTGPQRFARDVDRKADIQRIASALEIYRNDNQGYPRCVSGTTCTSNEISGLAPTYTSTIPTDTSPRLFRYTPAGCGASTCATFSLCMGLEKLPVPAPADISVVCGWPTANQGCGGSGYPCYEQVTNP